MDENKNPNEQRKISDDIKREVERRTKQSAAKATESALKNVAKAIAKAVATSIKWLISVLGPWGIAILLIIIFIIALTMNVFDTISTFFEDSQASTSSYTRIQTSADSTRAMVTITDDAPGYSLNGDYANELLKQLDSLQVDGNHYEFTNDDYSEDDDSVYLQDDELNNMIDKYLRAEIRTMLPTISSSTGIEGNISVYRKAYRVDGSTGTTEADWIEDWLNPIQNNHYVSYEDLKAMAKDVVDNDEEANNVYLKAWSINPENFKLCFLIEDERSYVWYNSEPPAEPDSVKITFELKEIEYMSVIQKWNTPINFLVALHLNAENIDFMEELVEKIKESEIILSLTYDPITTDEQVEIDGVKIFYRSVVIDPLTVSLEVDTLETWIYKVNTTIEKGDREWLIRSSNIQKYIDHNRVGDLEEEILTDEVIAFLDEYPDVRNNLESSTSLLYYALEQNENTQQLEIAMKYTIPQINGVAVETSVFNLLNEDNITATGLDMTEYEDTDEWADANEIQKNIVKIIVNNQIAGQKGYCLKWTRLVGEAAGAVTQGNMGYARNAGSQFGVSKDFTYIPLGAVLYGLGSTNSVYGHCGIYIGNDTVASCLGPSYANTVNGIKFDNISYFLDHYRVVCWGWYSTTPVNPKYPVSTDALMTNRKGVI